MYEGYDGGVRYRCGWVWNEDDYVLIMIAMKVVYTRC